MITTETQSQTMPSDPLPFHLFHIGYSLAHTFIQRTYTDLHATKNAIMEARPIIHFKLAVFRELLHHCHARKVTLLVCMCV